MSSEPWCWKCRHLKVVTAGELCRMCTSGWVSPYKGGKKPTRLEDWDLEKLIETQASGDVPGSHKWEDNEIPSQYISD